MNIGYIKSTPFHENIDEERIEIFQYSKTIGMVEFDFVVDRVGFLKDEAVPEIKNLLHGLKEGDTIIFPRLLTLGDSLVEILENLYTFADNKVSVHIIKEALVIDFKGLHPSKSAHALVNFISSFHNLGVSLRSEQEQKAKASTKVVDDKLSRKMIGFELEKYQKHKNMIRYYRSLGMDAERIVTRLGIGSIESMQIYLNMKEL